MSSQQKVISPYNASADCLKLEMGRRLQAVAGQALKNKLESGEVKVTNGRVDLGSELKVKRSANLRANNGKL